MLHMDAARPSIEDGSEAREEVIHACYESEGGSSEAAANGTFHKGIASGMPIAAVIGD